jgi:hypothetical protein
MPRSVMRQGATARRSDRFSKPAERATAWAETMDWAAILEQGPVAKGCQGELGQWLGQKVGGAAAPGPVEHTRETCPDKYHHILW